MAAGRGRLRRTVTKFLPFHQSKLRSNWDFVHVAQDGKFFQMSFTIQMETHPIWMDAAC